MSQNYKTAQWWEPLENKVVRCTLCPRFCTLKAGQRGFCYIRKNIDGSLFSTSYGKPTGFGLDPIEKKPLNHFYPGTEILSFGTIGCNMGCKFCQNWHISKTREEEGGDYLTAEDVILFAKKRRIPSIAFTYNDPNIFGEFVIDVSKLARTEGIRTVMVTAGYVNPDPRAEIYEYIDAANVDLKAFTNEFYQKLSLSQIAPVLDTILWLRKETDVWFELTTLLIPGENDSDEELKKMSDWILDELGPDVPVHFTAFHPSFKLTDKPRTDASTLINARNIAVDAGINYVYLGNVHSPETQTTYCPNCRQPVINRDWHSTTSIKIDNGHCRHCGAQIAGIFP